MSASKPMSKGKKTFLQTSSTCASEFIGVEVVTVLPPSPTESAGVEVGTVLPLHIVISHGK